MKNILLALFIAFALPVAGQNLVYNGNFESFSTCPNSAGQYNYCTGWTTFTTGTPDYLNSCNGGTYSTPSNFYGNQSAFGNAYMGIFIFTNPSTATNTIKEYIKGSLNTPLVVGKSYEVSMSVSLADNYTYGSDDIGVYFLKNSPSSYITGTVPPVTPQVTYSSYGPVIDKTNWVRLKAIFVADSAYDKLVVGSWKQAAAANTSFAGGSNTICYYYLDSVVVKLATNVSIDYSDSSLCAGQIITVPYTVSTPGYFSSGNTFSLQLSDINGNFSSPTILGTQSGTTSGSITATVPSVLVQGTGYRLRIKSSAPSDSSEISIKPVTIGNTQPVKPVINTNTPLCEGQNLNFTLTASPGMNYTWTGPNSFTSSIQNPSIVNATVAASGSYIVTTWSYGCYARDTELVNVYAVPGTPVVSANSPVCNGKDITLTANSATAGVNYLWSGPNNFTSSLQNPVIQNVNLAMNGMYTVVASLNGCSSHTATVNVMVQQFPSSVTVYPVPNDTICVGGTIQFVAVASNGGTNPQFRWMKNGNLISGATAISYTTGNIVTGDKISAILTPDNTCPDPDTSAYIEVAVLSYVTPSVTITASPGTLISPWQTITFTATPVNGGKNPTYQWKRNGQNIIGAVNDVWGAYTLSNNDTISVEMFSSEYCPSPASAMSNKIVVAVKTGVEDVKKEEGFVLYPNPNNGSFTLSGYFNGPVSVDIINALGSIVYRKDFGMVNGKTELSLNTGSGLPTGSYVLKLKTNEGILPLRLQVYR